ncbi:hypothetical protein ACWD7F_07595 [Streptomyces sp. NPDC005122]
MNWCTGVGRSGQRSPGFCRLEDITLWCVNRRKKGAANMLAALKSIRAARSDGAPIHVDAPSVRAPTPSERSADLG